MKNILIALSLISAPFVLTAQTATEEVKTGKDYNRWSVELNVGNNKPLTPFTSSEYFTSNPTNFVDIADFNHYDFGVRYMITPKFGFKIQANYDKFKNQKGSGSLDFESEMYHASFQGVANLAQALDFRSFTNRFGFLAHLGPWVGSFQPKLGQLSKLDPEFVGGITYGLTPQIRITDAVVFTFDLSYYTSFRQHYNWDGQSLQADSSAYNGTSSQNMIGTLYTFTAGLTFNLGGKDKHADWYNVAEASTNKKLEDKIAELESKLSDTDRDGILDFVDKEPNSVPGVMVNTLGQSIDNNSNGVPDDLEAKLKTIVPQISKDGKDGSTSPASSSKTDAIKTLVEKGYVNVFFDVNMDDPNVGSTNNVYQIIQFLRSYPDAKARITGFADVRGSESNNKDLSVRRAKKMYNILVASGINANRLTLEGQGVDNTYPTDTKIGLDLARRVSFVLE